MRSFVLILLLGKLSVGIAQVEQLAISTNWKFRQTGTAQWMPASVPGTVHTDLLANKKIPDPFLETNELQVQWIDTVSWEYETTFTYNKSEVVEKASLLFEGLDTYAKVYLNDSLILTANNMFRSWKVVCTSLLKNGQNRLTIHFSSAVKTGKEVGKNLPYVLPGEEKVFTRKAGYHYGWDWGPRFVTCGIWQPVKLLLQKGSLDVSNYQILQQEISEQQASLELITIISAQESTPITIQIFDALTKQRLGSTQHRVTTSEVLRTNFIIANPQRWWCTGYGDPYLYTLRIEITNTNTGEKINAMKKIGLRTIELIQEPDSIGKSFYFKLNGQPVFIKGANYIPPDNFIPRQSAEDYVKIVQQAVDANMNMLRVWGGGVYAEDAFYEACDEKGILVWQDFMFACVMYPGDEAFLLNVKEEAEQQIVRLRDHASIALWCGNNEVSEAWHNWG